MTGEPARRARVLGRWGGRAVVLAMIFVFAAGGSRAYASGLYVALGDSVAAGVGATDSVRGGYVGRLFGILYTPEGGGLTEWANRACCEDSGGLRGFQLSQALADIDAPSDTRVVTVDIGGNDRLWCASGWYLPSCPFAGNFTAILNDLQAALARDPGAEELVAMAYYNPASGLGPPDEPVYDQALLGTDLTIDCGQSGDRLGLNDLIFCIAGERGAQVADAYPPFKAGGQALMADLIHPNDQGHAAIARVFCLALTSVPDPSCPAVPPPLPTSAPPPLPPQSPPLPPSVRPPLPRSVPETVIAPDTTASEINAYRGVLVWSRKARNGRYRLVVRRRGLVRDAPIRSFRAPVNADLGPGRQGGVVAVYSRCATRRPTRRCDLFRLGLTTGRERRLRTPSSRRRAEFAPSTWKGRYAFGRAARFGISLGRPAFKRHRGAGLLKTGPRGRISGDLPDQTDLRLARVAYLTRRGRFRQNQLVRTQRFRRSGPGRSCTLIRQATSGGAYSADLWSPVLHGDYVYWLERFQDPLSISTAVVRRRVPDRRCRSRGEVQYGDRLGGGYILDPSNHSPNSLAVDGGRFFIAGDKGVREVRPRRFR